MGDATVWVRGRGSADGGNTPGRCFPFGLKNTSYCQ